MTIYSLMNKVKTLRFYVTIAAQSYREGRCYYSNFEDMARVSLETLADVGYISLLEYVRLQDELFHVFRMYKRH